MAPSNVLSMAQLRTLPLADQIKILMKNGGCSPCRPPPDSGGLRTKGQGQRLPLPRAAAWRPLEGQASRPLPHSCCVNLGRLLPS